MSKQIITDNVVFTEKFIPDVIIKRKTHIKEIVDCLRISLNGDFTSLYVCGTHGSGKTTIIKWILQKHFDRNFIYINCLDTLTSHRTLEDIIKISGGIVHGWESTDDLVSKFRHIARKRKLIVCLDDLDELKDPQVIKWLYSFCGMILVSNRDYSPKSVGYKTYQKISPNRIKFEPYTKDEILSILKHRVSEGLQSDSITDSHLDLVAVLCNGDSRIALQTVQVAARHAERNGSDIISIDNIRSGLRCTGKHNVSDILNRLNPYQKILFGILKEYREIKSSELYNKYAQIISLKSDVGNRTHRSYGNDMKGMRELGLVRQLYSGRYTAYEFVM